MAVHAVGYILGPWNAYMLNLSAGAGGCQSPRQRKLHLQMPLIGSWKWGSFDGEASC